MALRSLTPAESSLVRRLRRSLTMPMLVDYLDYLDLGGFEIVAIADIPVTASLHAKGWLTFPLDLALSRGNRVWLTEPAWNLFALTEWAEVERRRIEANRSPLWGLFS